MKEEMSKRRELESVWGRITIGITALERIMESIKTEKGIVPKDLQKCYDEIEKMTVKLEIMRPVMVQEIEQRRQLHGD